MPRTPIPKDFLERFYQLEERVRLLELRNRTHTKNKTWTVFGDLDLYSGGYFIPEFIFRFDPDQENAELDQVHTNLHAGSASLGLYQNGVLLDTYAAGIGDNYYGPGLGFPVSDKDKFEIRVASIAGGATTLSFTATFPHTVAPVFS